MRTASFTFLAAAVVLFGACQQQEEDLTLPEADPTTVLFLADFDNENGGAGVLNWTEFADWNVLDGCVDLHGNGYYDVQPGNGLYVDLDGTCDAGGTIETKEAFVFEAGQKYLLEFYLAGNHRIRRPDTVDLTLGTIHEEQFVLERDHPFTLYTREIQVAEDTPARIRFRNHGGDNQGALLDLVRIRRVVESNN